MVFIFIKQPIDSNSFKSFLRWSVPAPPDKFSYEIGRSFVDPLTIHSIDLSIESSRTKEVVFDLIFQSEVNL